VKRTAPVHIAVRWLIWISGIFQTPLPLWLAALQMMGNADVVTAAAG